MYDLERIGKIISEIEKYVKEIKEYNLTREKLKESQVYYASSMIIFAILNRIIDLGSEIISAEHLGAPNTYSDIMEILSKSNVINKEQAKKLNNLISKRNIFAHFYGDITEKDIYNSLSQLKEVELFLVTIKKRVSS